MIKYKITTWNTSSGYGNTIDIVDSLYDVYRMSIRDGEVMKIEDGIESRYGILSSGFIDRLSDSYYDLSPHDAKMAFVESEVKEYLESDKWMFYL